MFEILCLDQLKIIGTYFEMNESKARGISSRILISVHSSHTYKHTIKMSWVYFGEVLGYF